MLSSAGSEAGLILSALRSAGGRRSTLLLLTFFGWLPNRFLIASRLRFNMPFSAGVGRSSVGEGEDWPSSPVSSCCPTSPLPEVGEGATESGTAVTSGTVYCASGVRRWYRLGRNFARRYTYVSRQALYTNPYTNLIQRQRVAERLDCPIRGREWKRFASDESDTGHSVPVML
jgi:hypothetical protein